MCCASHIANIISWPDIVTRGSSHRDGLQPTDSAHTAVISHAPSLVGRPESRLEKLQQSDVRTADREYGVSLHQEGTVEDNHLIITALW